MQVYSDVEVVVHKFGVEAFALKKANTVLGDLTDSSYMQPHRSGQKHRTQKYLQWTRSKQ
jgi:hypothetical protein